MDVRLFGLIPLDTSLQEPAEYDQTNWWNGSFDSRSVIQIKDSAIIFYYNHDYYISSLEHYLPTNVTHAWFPKDAFDEVIYLPAHWITTSLVDILNQIGDGFWIFGRVKEDSFVGLFSAIPLKRGSIYATITWFF